MQKQQEKSADAFWLGRKFKKYFQQHGAVHLDVIMITEEVARFDVTLSNLGEEFFRYDSELSKAGEALGRRNHHWVLEWCFRVFQNGVPVIGMPFLGVNSSEECVELPPGESACYSFTAIISPGVLLIPDKRSFDITGLPVEVAYDFFDMVSNKVPIKVPLRQT